MPITLDRYVQQYILLRDKLKEFDEAVKLKRAVIKGTMDKIEGIMQGVLDEQKVTSAKTNFGTVYLSDISTASLVDKEAFMNFVIDHKRFDLIERRASATAVVDYVKENKQLPPGCNLNTITNVNVRRKANTGSLTEGDE